MRRIFSSVKKKNWDIKHILKYEIHNINTDIGCFVNHVETNVQEFTALHKLVFNGIVSWIYFVP
jgi:hypothetical protein